MTVSNAPGLTNNVPGDHALLRALSPEAELLLLCAGGAAMDARIRELCAGPIDWLKFGHLAQADNAVPIVWERINRVCGAALPVGSRLLEQVAVMTEFHLMATERALLRALRGFARAGIEPTLLKGAALAYAVYGGVTHRPMVDIDVLVDRAELKRAREVAVQNGWTWSGDAQLDELYARHHHLPPLNYTSHEGVTLELHADLFPAGHPFAFSASDIRAGARTIQVAGDVPVRAPRVEHLLLHACLHFVWSNQIRSGAWRTLRDVTTIAETQTIDWDAFVRDAQLARAATMCYWTLRLASRLVGAQVPADVIRTLRPRRSEGVLRRLERLLVYELVPSETICPSNAMFQAMWTFAVQPRSIGHGGVRPWHVSRELTEAYPADGAGEVRRGLRERIAYHSLHLVHWARYFRSLLSPPSALP